MKFWLVIASAAVLSGCLKTQNSICSGQHLLPVAPAVVGQHKLYWNRESDGSGTRYTSTADISIRDLGGNHYQLDSDAQFGNGITVHNTNFEMCVVDGNKLAQVGQYLVFVKPTDHGLFFNNFDVGQRFFDNVKELQQQFPELQTDLTVYFQEVNGNYVDVDVFNKTPKATDAMIDAFELRPGRDGADDEYSYQVK